MAKRLRGNWQPGSALARQAMGPPSLREYMASLVQSDAADQLFEAGIFADGIKMRMHFDELQNVGTLLRRAFQPDKSLVAVIKSQVGIHERPRGDVTFLAPPF